MSFTADPGGIARANLWLRCADRVLLQIGEFAAESFDELYEQTRTLPWEWVKILNQMAIRFEGRFELRWLGHLKNVFTHNLGQASLRRDA